MGGVQPVNSLLLVAHGSRRVASNDEIRTLTAKLREDAGTRFADVSCAFLELAEPSIPDAINQCIGRGATRVTVFPYFLSAGRHVASDIPAEVAAVASRYPDVEVVIAPYLGAAGAMSDLILQLVEEPGTETGEPPGGAGPADRSQAVT